MVEFEDPDAKYDFDGPKGGGRSAKTRVLALLVVFLLLIFFLARNNFRLDLLKTSIVSASTFCNPLYVYNQKDIADISLENAQNVLSDNIDELKKMEGFQMGQVKFSMPDQQGATKPVIILDFKGVSKTEKAIPGEICGFGVEVNLN